MLIVDADERITPELEREIRLAIRRTEVDGFDLNRRFWSLGGWIRPRGDSDNCLNWQPLLPLMLGQCRC